MKMTGLRIKNDKNNSELPNIRQPNLIDQVYYLLLDMIINGKYKIDDLLPPEKVLCEELGVSRTVIRESLKLLEARGVIEVIHGKGVRVIPPTMQGISDAFQLYLKLQKQDISIRDLLIVRLAIEPEIARQATLKADEEEVEMLSDLILNQGEKVLDDIKAYASVDLDFHLMLANMTHNILFITIIDSLVNPLHSSIIETFHDAKVHGHTDHKKIVMYMKERDHEGAKEMMINHLKMVENILDKKMNEVDV